MNDLIVVEKIAQWQRLKALVLDSAFPDYKACVQHGSGRVLGLVPAGAPASRFLQGHGERLARVARSTRTRHRRRHSRSRMT